MKLAQGGQCSKQQYHQVKKLVDVNFQEENNWHTAKTLF